MDARELRKLEPAEEDLVERIIGAATEVHRVLGPGMLESAYEKCFCEEMKLRQLHFERQRPVPLDYKGTIMDCGYRINFLVENQVIVELKAVEPEQHVSEVQMRTYLKLANKRVGLILNLFVPLFRNGIRRVVV